jgi:hypothetical protein
MRKVITGAFVSLDGVMQAPGGPQEDPTRGFELARIIHEAGRSKGQRRLSSYDRHRRPSPHGEGW